MRSEQELETGSLEFRTYNVQLGYLRSLIISGLVFTNLTITASVVVGMVVAHELFHGSGSLLAEDRTSLWWRARSSRPFGGRDLGWNQRMQLNHGWVFTVGLALLLVLAALIGKRLPREYRNRLGPGFQTVALVWALLGVHFTLVVLAAVWSTWHFSIPAPLGVGVGMALAGLGATLCLCAAYAFWSFKRLNFLEHTRLVTEGIYRWSRNPQLVGWTFVLVGLGLIRGSAMVLVLALLFWLSYRLHLSTEEEHLRRIFGGAYEEYRQRTARYFGLPHR